MTRQRVWWLCFASVLLMSIGLFTYLRPGDKLLTDSDTTLIITEIEKRHDPWRWWHHDWPLDNHFYRPIVSDLFELELRMHPHNDYDWGLTCDLLAFLTTLGLFWLLREMTDNPLVSTASTGLFILWEMSGGSTVGFTELLSSACTFTAGAVVLVGLWRQRHTLRRLRVGRRARRLLVQAQKPKAAARVRIQSAIAKRVAGTWWSVLTLILPAALVWYWLGENEISGFASLGFRMLAWIPGRTASSMTVFAFVALAAFARYMRLMPRHTPRPTALDRPNTRSSEPPSLEMPSVVWPLVAVAAEALALLCYEQAVMVPAVLCLIGLAYHYRGAKGRWWLWGIPFGATLVGYIALRHAFIPPTTSFYYNEQKRTTATAIRALNRYLFFFYASLDEMWFYVRESPIMFLISTGPWLFILSTIAGVTSLWQMRRRWVLAGFAWLASAVSYAPMAWFKDFEHYHYWSMAFRALFDVMMIWIAIDLTVIACSPRARKAPRRLAPAPGSLPRP